MFDRSDLTPDEQRVLDCALRSILDRPRLGNRTVLGRELRHELRDLREDQRQLVIDSCVPRLLTRHERDGKDSYQFTHFGILLVSDTKVMAILNAALLAITRKYDAPGGTRMELISWAEILSAAPSVADDDFDLAWHAILAARLGGAGSSAWGDVNADPTYKFLVPNDLEQVVACETVWALTALRAGSEDFGSQETRGLGMGFKDQLRIGQKYRVERKADSFVGLVSSVGHDYVNFIVDGYGWKMLLSQVHGIGPASSGPLSSQVLVRRREASQVVTEPPDEWSKNVDLGAAEVSPEKATLRDQLRIGQEYWVEREGDSFIGRVNGVDEESVHFIVDGLGRRIRTSQVLSIRPAHVGRLMQERGQSEGTPTAGVDSPAPVASGGLAARQFSIPGYVLGAELGSGAGGRVFRALENSPLSIGRAIKVIEPYPWGRGEDPLPRFKSEAQALFRLEHPAVVRYVSSGLTDDEYRFPYLIMELVEGKRLRDVAGSMTFPERVAAVIDVLDGLTYVHGAGVYHRDVKEANIVVRSDGQSVLVDFGLAYLVEAELDADRSRYSLGTPGYVPYEAQADPKKSRSPKYDVFSAGVTLYRLFTSPGPDRDDYRRLAAIDESLSGLDRIVLKAIAREADRYSTAAEFADELRAWLTPEPNLHADTRAVAEDEAAPSDSDVVFDEIRWGPNGLAEFELRDIAVDLSWRRQRVFQALVALVADGRVECWQLSEECAALRNLHCAHANEGNQGGDAALVQMPSDTDHVFSAIPWLADDSAEFVIASIASELQRSDMEVLGAIQCLVVERRITILFLNDTRARVAKSVEVVPSLEQPEAFARGQENAATTDLYGCAKQLLGVLDNYVAMLGDDEGRDARLVRDVVIRGFAEPARVLMDAWARHEVWIRNAEIHEAFDRTAMAARMLSLRAYEMKPPPRAERAKSEREIDVLVRDLQRDVGALKKELAQRAIF